MVDLAVSRGAVVTCAQRHAQASEPASPPSVRADLTNATETADLLRASRPDWVIHLAALASVAQSWKDPQRTILANAAMSINLLEAVRGHAPTARVLVVGSGDMYGPWKSRASVALDEKAPLEPSNPYAFSKASCDLLAAHYAHVHGLDIVRMRPFNHTGPGQSDTYVISSFARQIAEMERDSRPDPVLRVGNLDVGRDFTDVRDVVRAYWAALERAPAGAYNVASGRAVTVRGALESLIAMSPASPTVEVDPDRVRAVDTSQVRGDAAKLARATGWRAEIPFEQTLSDTLAWWRERIGNRNRTASKETISR